MKEQIPASEYNALVELYEATGGADWHYRGGWLNPDASYWNQVGVTSGHVTYLGLGHNNLTGELPDSLANLTKLEELQLSGNHLAGGIPDSLGTLADLEILHLGGNEFSGGIPSSLGGLGSLRVLSVAGNQLSGEIPDSLGGLTNLEALHVYSNQLTGEIPAALGNLPNLIHLGLNSNQLTGGIPESLGNLTSLWNLRVDNNRLTGAIPGSLGNLSNLQSFYLSQNFLGEAVASDEWAQLRSQLQAAGVSVYDLPQNEPPVGQVQSVTGDAWVVRDGTEVPVSAEADIYEGDVIVTGPSSAIAVIFNDESRVVTGADSRFEVREYVYDSDTQTGKAIHSLAQGIVDIVSGFISSKSDEDGLEVRTPVALIGVRGTEFTVEYQESDGAGTTTVSVVSGLIEVTDILTGTVVSIEAGESTTVIGPLTDPEVKAYGISKTASYEQTSASTRQPAPQDSLCAELFVEASNPESLNTAAVTAPGDFAYSLEQRSSSSTWWERAETFADQASLDAAFPDGSYTVVVGTADDRTDTGQLQLAGGGYPPAPQVTNYDEAQQIDPAVSFPLAWAPFSGAGGQDSISLTVKDPVSGAVVFEPGWFPADATMAVIPSGVLEPGQTYRAWVTFRHVADQNNDAFWKASGFASYESRTALEIRTDGNASDPRQTNDDLADAIEIAGAMGTTTGSSVGATRENGEPLHDGVGRSSVWWQWAAPADGMVMIDTFGSDYDTVLAVYTGTLDDLTVVAANDDSRTDYSSIVEFAAMSGATYYIAVAGFDGDTGSVVLTWEMPDAGELPTGFTAWAEQLPPEVRGETDDPGSRGIVNLLRYAFAMDPLQPDRKDLPRLGRELVGDGAPEQEHLVLSFKRRKNATDLTYALEATDALDGWASVLSSERVTDDGNGETETVTFTDSEPIDGKTKRFLRIRVTR